jgi:hypothetical protein
MRIFILKSFKTNTRQFYIQNHDKFIMLNEPLVKETKFIQIGTQKEILKWIKNRGKTEAWENKTLRNKRNLDFKAIKEIFLL